MSKAKNVATPVVVAPVAEVVVAPQTKRLVDRIAPEVLDAEIASYRAKLAGCADTNEKKKIRRALRTRGWYQSRQPKTTPVAAVAPVTPVVETPPETPKKGKTPKGAKKILAA